MRFEPDNELLEIRQRLVARQQQAKQVQELARVTGNKKNVNVLYGGGNWTVRSPYPTGMVEHK